MSSRKKTTILADKIKNRFIYTSDTSRGLRKLIEYFHEIHLKEPSCELFVFRDKETFVNEHESLLEEMEKCSYITYGGEISQDQLSLEFLKAEFWVYPTNFLETYCMNALEAMLSKCVCISSNLGALTNLLGEDRGVLLKSNIYSDEYKKEFIDEIIRLINDDDSKTKYKEKGYEWAKEQIIENIGNKWMEMFKTECKIKNKDDIIHSLFSKYIFYPNKDIIGFDHQDSGNDLELISLYNHSEMSDEISGFNTAGYFKNINVPFDKMYDLDYNKHKGQKQYKGLFIKKSFVEISKAKTPLDKFMYHYYHLDLTINNNENNKRCAVIVEPRITSHLIAIIKNVMSKLDDTWNLHIFCGNLNENYIKEHIKGNYKLTNTKVENFGGSSYSIFFQTTEFWNEIIEEDILLFQIDSFINNNDNNYVDKFLEMNYAFVGASYTYTFIREDKYVDLICCKSIGCNINGGFCLRKKSAMIKCIEEVSYEMIVNYRKENDISYEWFIGIKGKNMSEDVFFQNALEVLGYSLPPKEICDKFASQQTINYESFGVHGFDKSYGGFKKKDMDVFCRL